MADWLYAFLRGQDALPTVLVVGIVVASLIWNAHSGLVWTTPLSPILWVFPLICLGIAAVFTVLLPNRRVAELAIYIALWSVFPVFAVRFNYLTATLNFPLQDRLFLQADALLGFDWRTWASLAWSHPFVIQLLQLAYWTNIIQPFLLICVFAFWGPQGRNRELLTATIIAYLATVAIFAVLPAFGPQRAHGLSSAWDATLLALRSGQSVTLPYLGIVSFPSFHAAMALLLAASVRHNRFMLGALAMVNGLMLLATIPIGYHYLVDIIAGCAIGVGAHYFVCLLERRDEPSVRQLASQ